MADEPQGPHHRRHGDRHQPLPAWLRGPDPTEDPGGQRPDQREDQGPRVLTPPVKGTVQHLVAHGQCQSAQHGKHWHLAAAPGR
ncbi:hypothetical protein FM114_06910 [Luteococcus japonicus LSP_Lj1]|uniref:Uncharacterized protein n=1 Tax=Luteococcus japonicus LSP_Lj1 TaxID=1255658 RepID=A0A1R4JDB7_9ACTN|nr:hypothetical protein FM114_06910 [Luteococcus japonicus LSP_Lj1]